MTDYTMIPIDLSKFDTCRVLVIGDLMIDEYVWGDVTRISPEAPVPVVHVKREEMTLGGAGNVVNNLITLGAKVFVGGVIGNDPRGKMLLDLFVEIGADVSGIFVDPNRPTIRKTRIIASNQQMLRIDREIKSDVSEEILASIVRFVNEKLSEIDIVIISDYGKGVVTTNLLKRIIPVIRGAQKPIIADPKGLDFTKYCGVSVLTPNKKEAAQASGVEIIDQLTLEKSAKKLLAMNCSESLLITCGPEGMVLFEKNNEPVYIKAEAREVYDVSGAGDTVVAVLGLALATGASLTDAASVANTAAGIVVGKVGTATVTKQELLAALNEHSDKFTGKYRSITDLPLLCKDLRNKGKRIVLTNGCFDLLHVGHIMFLSASKKAGDVLMVAVDDDESVRKLKGAGRPVIRAQERIRIISALDCVDYVIKFSTDELPKLIELIRPDVLTKGSNYSENEVIGRELVEKYGGKVVLYPITETVSSSEIIHSIRNSLGSSG